MRDAHSKRLGAHWLTAFVAGEPVAIEQVCHECDGEGVVLVGSGHNDREVPCRACQEEPERGWRGDFANTAVLP